MLGAGRLKPVQELLQNHPHILKCLFCTHGFKWTAGVHALRCQHNTPPHTAASFCNQYLGSSSDLPPHYQIQLSDAGEHQGKQFVCHSGGFTYSNKHSFCFGELCIKEVNHLTSSVYSAIQFLSLSSLPLILCWDPHILRS